LQAGEGLYRLPPSLPAGTPLAVEIRSGDETLRRQYLSIVDDFEWQWTTPAQLFDRFGRPVDASQLNPPGVAGALLAGMLPAAAFFSPPPSCFAGRRVFFVGSIPGQIVSWPAEELPSTWTPVWAVPMGRRGRAIYCGLSLDGAAAREGAPVSMPARKIRDWKDLLARQHQRITPPSGGRLRQLWKQYQEVARRVRA
jgi:hypothetical protein